MKTLWSRIIGTGFIAEDIRDIYPEENMRFVTIAWQGGRPHSSFQLRDFNLRELDEIKKWIEEALPQVSLVDVIDDGPHEPQFASGTPDDDEGDPRTPSFGLSGDGGDGDYPQ